MVFINKISAFRVNEHVGTQTWAYISSSGTCVTNQMLIKTTQLFVQFYCSVLTVAYFVLQHDGKMPQNYKEKKIFKTLLESGTVFLSLFIDLCFLS